MAPKVKNIFVLSFNENVKNQLAYFRGKTDIGIIEDLLTY